MRYLSLSPVECTKVKDRMLSGSKMIRAWSKANSKYKLPASWNLTRTRLHLKTGKYCHYSGKGWHTMALMEWLVCFLEEKNFDPEIKTLVWSGNHVMRLMHNARENGLLLTLEEQQEVHTVGEYHVRLFLHLHQKYAQWGSYRLFHPRPKVHMMMHIFDTSSRRNPVGLSCYMDEEWVKQVSRLAKGTHSRTGHRTTLQRYSAGVCSNFIMCPVFICFRLARSQTCCGQTSLGLSFWCDFGFWRWP